MVHISGERGREPATLTVEVMGQSQGAGVEAGEEEGVAACTITKLITNQVLIFTYKPCHT